MQYCRIIPAVILPTGLTKLTIFCRNPLPPLGPCAEPFGLPFVFDLGCGCCVSATHYRCPSLAFSAQKYIRILLVLFLFFCTISTRI